jgi:hypothetical protein
MPTSLDTVTPLFTGDDPDLQAGEDLVNALDRLIGHFKTEMAAGAAFIEDQVDRQVDTLVMTGAVLSSPGIQALLPAMPDTAAMEGILDTVRDKIAAWVAKIAEIAGALTKRIFGIVGKIYEKIKAFIAAIGHGVAHVTSAIIAHPFSTLMMMASAVAGVPAIVGLVTRSSLPASIAALRSWYGVIGKGLSQSAFGKLVKVKISQAGLTFTPLPIAAPTAKSASALGYTGQKVRHMLNQLARLFRPDGGLRRAFGAVTRWITEGLKMIQRADKMVMGPQKTALTKGLRFIWSFFRYSIVTPLGLLITAISRFISSYKKVRGQPDPEEEAGTAVK